MTETVLAVYRGGKQTSEMADPQRHWRLGADLWRVELDGRTVDRVGSGPGGTILVGSLGTFARILQLVVDARLRRDNQVFSGRDRTTCPVGGSRVVQSVSVFHRGIGNCLSEDEEPALTGESAET